jgi:hypothetical protein
VLPRLRDLRTGPELKGILYSAVGDAYFAEALTSARSSLRFNRIPHLILTDAQRDVSDGGLSVRVAGSSGNPFADKIRAMIASPFEQTIFLDTDTYVLDDLSQVFSLLDRFDVVAAHAPGYRGLADPDVPSAFYELNTGVLGWRQTPATRALLTDWLATYERWSADPPFPGAGNDNGLAGDQPAFRRCVWEHRLQLCVLGHEYNLRTQHCGQVVHPVRVIHGRHQDYERVAAIVNAEAWKPRVFTHDTFGVL